MFNQQKCYCLGIIFSTGHFLIIETFYNYNFLNCAVFLRENKPCESRGQQTKYVQLLNATAFPVCVYALEKCHEGRPVVLSFFFYFHQTVMIALLFFSPPLERGQQFQCEAVQIPDNHKTIFTLWHGMVCGFGFFN